ALYYFDLVRIYSYIPGAVVSAQDKAGVILSTKGIAGANDALNYKPARAPIDSVYLQVVDDLTKANGLLTIPTAASAGVNIANRLGTQALLAKVNLYRKNYAEAKRWSDSCITNGGSRITTTANYVSQWRAATSQEVLFQA